MATGTEKGFTLVELLVVVAIVGVVLAVAAVNLWPSDEEVAAREAGLLALRIEKARDTAWFGGRPVAISFAEGRLRHWRLTGDRSWEHDTALERPLGEAQVTAVHLDGAPLAATERIVFLPDGFGIPFRISLEIRGIPRAIEGDMAGSLAVLSR